MPTLDYRKPLTRYVGDNKSIEFTVLKANGQDLKDLTGHAAWVTFSHPNAVPYLIRAAKTNGVLGTVTYEETGAEWNTAEETLVQLTLKNPDSFEHSLPYVRVLVTA